MSAMTSIEWTATVHPDGTVTPGRTWNPVTGCTKVSAGCKNCYAEGIAKRLWPTSYPPMVGPESGVVFPRQFTDVLTHEDRLLEPLSWRKPSKVFVNSMSDLFHEDVPDWFISEVFATMALAPRHTFQILTKRPERMRQYFERLGSAADVAVAVFKRFTVLREADVQSRAAVRVWPLPNVWLGTSVENQPFADERIPLLLQTPAAVRFISAEPLLGPVDVSMWIPAGYIASEGGQASCDGLDWIIVGGESGPKARPCDLAWVRSIVAQCQSAGVPVFVKQLGAKPILEFARGCDQFITLKDRKGGDLAEWPDDLRVRQFPKSVSPIQTCETRK